MLYLVYLKIYYSIIILYAVHMLGPPVVCIAELSDVSEIHENFIFLIYYNR